jgi:hypothetical protein
MATIFDCTVGIKKNNSNIDQIGQDFGHDWMRLDENWTKSSFILDGTLKINEFMVAWEKCSVSLKFCPALTQNNLYNKFCTKAALSKNMEFVLYFLRSDLQISNGKKPTRSPGF